MNGGRKKWELEKRAADDRAAEARARSNYPIPPTDESIRAYRREVEDTLGPNAVNLVDVRSPDEFTGKIIAPPGHERNRPARRAHPRRKSIPWSKAANEDGTFKIRDELREALRRRRRRFRQADDRLLPHRRAVEPHVVRAEVSAGRENVKNYDGSWTEWGNLVGAPIETGEGTSTPLAGRQVRYEPIAD